MNDLRAIDVSALPDYGFSHRTAIWWGIVGLIVVESTVFASLVASFFYLQLGHAEWPPDGTAAPELLLPSIATLILLASAIPMYLGDRDMKRGITRTMRITLPISIAMAVLFLAIKAYEYRHIGFWWDTHSYGSIVWAIAGFHSAHVLALVLKTIVVAVLAWRGYFSPTNRIGVTVNGLYWYFVVVVWIPLYATIYIGSQLLSE